MGLNAQTSVPVFTAGQILTAQQQKEINTGIPVFSTTVTRDAAFGGTGEKTLAEGQFAYLEDSNTTQYYDGAAWQTVGGGAWQAYTPTLTNATLGNGTLTGSYTQIGKLVIGRAEFVLGSTSSLTGAGLRISIPVTAVSANCITGTIRVFDFGASFTYGTINPDTTTQIDPVLYVTNALFATPAAITSSAPMTWTTNDTLRVFFYYEAA